MNASPESVGSVSERLDLPLVSVCRMVSDLCAEYGPDRIVVVPSTMRRTTLSLFAVECIAERAPAPVGASQ